jgi:hypothetical protein
MNQVSRYHPFYNCNKCGNKFQVLSTELQELIDEEGNVFEAEVYIFDPNASYNLANDHDIEGCEKQVWSWEDESCYYD